MATSGTVGPSYYAQNSFEGSDVGGNMPDPRQTAQSATSLIVMSTATPDPGYGVKVITYHVNGGTAGSNDGWNSDSTWMRWYAYLGSTQLAQIGAIGPRNAGQGFDYTYTFSQPQQSFPDIRIYCEAQGDQAYGAIGPYISKNYAVWSTSTVTWTTEIISKRARMII